MVPRKLVEAAFRNKLMLVLPVLLVPLLAVALNNPQPIYRTTATVWVADPPDADVLLGHKNPYQTPAQNQAVVINDLLSTRVFRQAVAERAGLVQPGGSFNVWSMEVWAGATGVNLLQVGVVSAYPELAPRIVQAVIDEYLERATFEGQRNLNETASHYETQLGVAQAELDRRRADLSSFVGEHPQVTISGRTQADLEYQALQSNVEYQNKVVQDLRNRIQDAELRFSSSASSQAAAFSLQDPPAVPDAPIPPSITRTLGVPLAALLFGVAISAALLYARYRLDHSLASLEDLSGLDVVVLGAVPELVAPGFLRRVPLVRLLPWATSRGFARSTARGIGSSPEETPL